MSANQVMFKTLNISRASGVPVLILSSIGRGKTSTVYKYAQENGYKVTELRGSTSAPEDILGYYVNEGDEYLKVKFPEWFIRLVEDGKNNQPHILFIDELTTVGKATQAALLKLIFDREIHGVKLPESCIIVSAGNYAANLSHSFGLLTPTLNRFCIVNVTADKNDYIDFIYGHMKGLDSVKYPDTLKTVDVSAIEDNLAIGFRGLLQKFGKEINKTKLRILDLNNDDYTAVDNVGGKVYGILSPRTLSYMKRMCVACAQLGYTEDVDFIPLGLIGFGTGQVTDENLLLPYHKEVCRLFYNAMSGNISSSVVDPEQLEKALDSLDKKLSNGISPFDYCELITEIKESVIGVCEKLEYINANDESNKQIKNVFTHLAASLTAIRGMLHSKTDKNAKAFKSKMSTTDVRIHDSNIQVIFEVISKSSKIQTILKDSNEVDMLTSNKVKDYLYPTN